MKKIAWGAGAIAIVAASALMVARVRSTRAEDVAGLETVRVARRDIGAVVKATGVIKPRIAAEVGGGSRLPGVVRRLYVQVGDTVRKGERLAQLDERDLVARRDEAAAALQQA